MFIYVFWQKSVEIIETESVAIKKLDRITSSADNSITIMCAMNMITTICDQTSITDICAQNPIIIICALNLINIISVPD